MDENEEEARYICSHSKRTEELSYELRKDCAKEVNCVQKKRLCNE
jgi:hypothetical protein